MQYLLKNFLLKDVNKVCKDFCQGIEEIIKEAQNKNISLQKENEALKSEHYKDNEIQRLSQEIQQYKDLLSMSFTINEEEREEINTWQKNHIKKCNKHGYSDCGAIGGCFDYIFNPTSIGDIGQIQCSLCGNVFTFRELK